MKEKNARIEEVFKSALQKHKENNFEIAEKLYCQILDIDNNHIKSIFLLGTLYAQTRNLALAKKLLTKATQINPDHADAYYNLGNVLKDLKEFEEAINCYEKTLKINPNNADANNNLGNLLKEEGEEKKAIPYYEKAIKINPSYANSYNNLGVIYQNLEDFEKAINFYKKAIEISPNFAEAYYNLGNVFKVSGQFDKSIIAYSNAIKYNSNNLVYFYILSELKNEILNSDLKKKILKILYNNKISELNITYANFLLADYEKRDKNYEKEFNYLLKAHLSYFKYNKERFHKGTHYWLNLLPNIEKLSNIKKSNIRFTEKDKKINPIFIVGVPRCGSTLVEKIIASGKEFLPMGEETGIIGLIVKDFIVNKSEELDLKKIQSLIFEKYNERKLFLEKKNYTFTDKSLDNFFYLDLIERIFPNAKIINCNRDALSSIMSIIKNNLNDVPWAHNVEHIFNYFDIYYKKVENFKEKFPNLIYDLKYEKLVNDPINESKKLLDFCNLNWDKGCLEFYKRKLVSKTASNIQIRRPVYKDSIKKYLDYKAFFKQYENRYSWFY